jgi:TonB-linked SusC/RagA family outer membrane protein
MIKLLKPGLTCFLLFALFQISFAQTKTVTGVVSDDKGNLLQGATVTVKNSKTATITDANGKFTLAITPNAQTLVVSYVGMTSQEVAVAGNSSFIVSLQSTGSQLNDVVVIGYGTARRSNITSAISSVNEKDIKNLPVAGVDQMLQGKAAGVTVTSNSGQPGGGVSVLIRGITTVNGNQPLYVVDGVPIHTSTSSGGMDYLGGVNGQTQESPLATLNPSDIVSIDILKDASAQAIYGAEGGNGVILITTKHGSSTGGKLEYDMYYGQQQIQNKLPAMNLKQYAEYFNSVLNDPNSGVTDTIGEFKNTGLLGPGTDWQDAIFQTGYIQNHQLSFSGGSGKSTYYFSGNYYDQKGILINTGFKRYSLRMGVDQQVKSWLKAGISTNLSNSDQTIAVTDGQQSVISAVLYNSPATPVKNFDGTYVNSVPVQSVAFGNAQNPVALAELRDVHARQSKAYGNIYADVQFTKDFSFKTQFNYDFQLTNNSAFQPNIVNPNGIVILAPSKYRVDKANNLYYGLQNYLTYNHNFNQHSVNVVVGHEASFSRYENSQVSVTGLTQNIESLAAGTPDPASPANGGIYEGSSESYFARINYTYDNKYSLTLSGRRDGSSNFGPDKRIGYFPGASAGWTITNENFAKDGNVLTYLKLRLGAGSVGISSAPANSYTTNIRLATNASGLFGQPSPPGIVANVGNPDLHWESVVTYNAGIDATLFKRIDISLDVYKKITKDMLLATVLPSFAGLDPNPPNLSYQEIEPPYTNAGQMTNTGVDLSINSRNIQSKNFTWNTQLIFSHYKNVLDKLYAPGIILFGKSQAFAPVTLTESIAGEPIGSFYGYVTDGLYRGEDELAKGPDQGLPVGVQGLWLGDIRYKDLDGDGKITPADQTFIGNPNPKFTYGLTNSFSYKGFDLSIFLQGVYGSKIFNYSRTETESLFNVYSNQLTTVMNRFTSENTNGALPRYNQYSQNNLKISDRFIEDGSYLRIQNVSLGYNLPVHWISKLKMTSFKVYVSGQNLYTFTKYSGYDPELGAFNSNVLAQNIDYGHYPNPRSVTIGANIVF